MEASGWMVNLASAPWSSTRMHPNPRMYPNPSFECEKIVMKIACLMSQHISEVRGKFLVGVKFGLALL